MDVVRCTCRLANIEDFYRFNMAYSEYFTGLKPTRTTVQSVLGAGIKVEIDAIARVPATQVSIPQKKGLTTNVVTAIFVMPSSPLSPARDSPAVSWIQP